MSSAALLSPAWLATSKIFKPSFVLSFLGRTSKRFYMIRRESVGVAAFDRQVYNESEISFVSIFAALQLRTASRSRLVNIIFFVLMMVGRDW